MHHAERNVNKKNLDSESRQLDDITKTGVDIAKLLAKRFKEKKISAIISSPYLRCMHTAKIINKYHKLSIVEDCRLNEKNMDEEWKDFLKRNMEAIDDVVNSYNDDDTIIFVTSGVNFSAFVCYFYNIDPTNDVPWSQASDISPITFTIGKRMLD